MAIDVVMRAHNDMPLIRQTLDAFAAQQGEWRLVAFDNASNDGTREALDGVADQVIEVPAGQYVPGRVLNQAMAATQGEFVIFLNSDCTPQHVECLQNLVAGFESDEKIAAVFGCQVPRLDCWTLFAKDTDDTFGDGRRQQYWKHCFSMASSAIRRSTWEQIPFDEALQYSEDIDWTWRVRQAGWKIQYVADSRVMHSHNYTLRQFFKRQYGEGKAEAAIFDWTPWERRWLRYSLLPFGRQVLSDWKYCLSHAKPKAFLHSPALRMAQMLGRRKGFNEGMAIKENKA